MASCDSGVVVTQKSFASIFDVTRSSKRVVKQTSQSSRGTNGSDEKSVESKTNDSVLQVEVRHTSKLWLLGIPQEHIVLLKKIFLARWPGICRDNAQRLPHVKEPGYISGGL